MAAAEVLLVVVTSNSLCNFSEHNLCRALKGLRLVTDVGSALDKLILLHVNVPGIIKSLCNFLNDIYLCSKFDISLPFST